MKPKKAKTTPKSETTAHKINGTPQEKQKVSTRQPKINVIMHQQINLCDKLPQIEGVNLQWLVLQDKEWRDSLKFPKYAKAHEFIKQIEHIKSHPYAMLQKEHKGAVLQRRLLDGSPCETSPFSFKPSPAIGLMHNARGRAANYAREVAAQCRIETPLSFLANKLKTATGDELIDTAMAIGEQAILARIITSGVSLAAMTGEKRMQDARTGANTTKITAEKRAAEIRQKYLSEKNKNPSYGRKGLIAATVEHFQGTLKRPRKYYTSRTVEAATAGL